MMSQGGGGGHRAEMLAAAKLGSLEATVAPSNEPNAKQAGALPSPGLGAEEDAGLAWQEKAKFSSSARRGVGCVC